ncbi:hypothetical protein phiV208_58 [Vibrio phage phiV208]|nr:hypothetical protein phiV208_58 [Vibrio phage phiV208]
MPSIQVTGQLVDPTTGVEGSADIRIASVINYGQTTKKSISHKSTDASGNYDFQLVYGKHLILVKFDGEQIYNRIGCAVVGDSTPDPIELIQLINLSDENPPSELVTELQQLREDTLNDIVDTSAQALENAGYQGEWVSGTSTALKGETWQVGGRYYVALKDTSVDPINDNDNWREVVNTESVTTAQNDILGGSVFKGSNGDYVQNGDTVPSGTTHLSVLVGSETKIVAMSLVLSGAVSNYDDYNLTVDIGGTSSLLRKVDNFDYKAKNSNNFANVRRKIQKDDGSETLTINVNADSLGYGEDTTVDPQPADPTPTVAGRVHTQTRASDPWPQSLETYLSPLFQNTVTVNNRGYSGDNTKAGWNDWDLDAGQDLTIICYGTNDAAFGFSPYQTLEEYLHYYRLIIEREIRKFNSAVMLMTPPPQKQLSANTRLLDAYREAVYQLADEYGCPVIDGPEMLKNVDSTLFSDNVHFRSLGYQVIASNVQARILAKISNPSVISGGSNMTVRFPEEGVKARFYNWGTQLAKASQVTPPLTSFTGGYVIETSSFFEKFVFAFYCEKDDVIAMPNVEVANSTLAVQLNNGIWQPQYTFDDRVQKIGDLTSKPLPYYEYSVLDDTKSINRNSVYDIAKANRIHIPTRGWYTLTLYIKSNGSTGSPRLTIGGVNFESYEMVEVWDRHFYGLFGNQKPVGNVTPRYIGQLYTDKTPATTSDPTTEVVWISTGLNNNNWKILSNIDISVALDPNGNVTPYSIGQMCLDTANGFKWYKASGLTSSNWVQISNN